MAMGMLSLVGGRLGGDGISRGAGHSRRQAMRCNAPPLSWGAGPPLGYEAAPDRAVRRLNLGANLRDCSHARLIWIGRNQTRLLSLIPVAQVNSGTRTASGTQVRAALRELHVPLACNSSQPRDMASYRPAQYLRGWNGLGGSASIQRRPAPVWGLAHQIRHWPKSSDMF